MPEMKNVMDRINNRQALQKKKINEGEDVVIETSKVKHKKKIKKYKYTVINE